MMQRILGFPDGLVSHGSTFIESPVGKCPLSNHRDTPALIAVITVKISESASGADSSCSTEGKRVARTPMYYTEGRVCWKKCGVFCQTSQQVTQAESIEQLFGKRFVFSKNIFLKTVFSPLQSFTTGHFRNRQTCKLQ